MSNATHVITEGNPKTNITFIVKGDSVEVFHGSGKAENIAGQIYPAVRSTMSIAAARMIYKNYISIGFRPF